MIRGRGSRDPWLISKTRRWRFSSPTCSSKDENAVQLVRSFFEQGKPVAAICHAPWTLIEAGVVRGRTLTSFPSLQTDLRNAGANWVNEEVVVDEGLVTSRNPADLPAFSEKMLEEFAEGRHEGPGGRARRDRAFLTAILPSARWS